MVKTQKIIDVTGISSSDILNWEFEEINKLSDKNLRNLTSRIVSSANKRLRRIEKSGKEKYNVPYKKVMEKGNFSVKGKTRQQVLQEYARAKEFMESKTSSLSGYKAYRQKVKIRLGIPNATDEEELEVWKEINYINEHSRNNYSGIFDSNQFHTMVAKAKVKGKSHKQILSMLSREYKKAQAKQSERLKELESDLEDETEL